MFHEKHESGFGAFLGTFLLGAATGAAVALLTAPKTGREAREWLRTKAEDLGESMERIPDALQRAGSKAMRAGQEAYGTAKEELASYRADSKLDRFGK